MPAFDTIVLVMSSRGLEFGRVRERVSINFQMTFCT